MFDAVILDVDGVLTDSEPLHLEATNQVLSLFDASLSEEGCKAYLGMDERSFWLAMIERFHLKESPEALGEKRIHAAVNLIREGIVPMPGVPEFVSGLLMRGYPIAAASSSSRPVVETILTELGLRRSFKVVISGDQVACGKPEPEIFLMAARTLNGDPKQCMVVEDSPKGITAARRADMFIVAVQNRYNLNLDLSQADRIFSGLDHFDWSLLDDL
ncbi:MAG: HAD family phosphatase [Planctomycetota bacterium]